MITRIVKMTFDQSQTDNFKTVFAQKQNLIAGFDGCIGVELLQDTGNNNVFFTISKWQNEDYLNQYRHSPLFKETWSTVKQWFIAAPEAYSLETSKN